MKRLVVIAALALGACVEEPPVGPQGKPLTPAERAECVMKGGEVGRGGLLPDELCFLPQADAGKACEKDGDCKQGEYCRAPDPENSIAYFHCAACPG